MGHYYKDGIMYETPPLTEAEQVAADEAMATYFIAEKTRPLSLEEVIRMVISKTVNDLDTDDETALRMSTYYPEWKVGEEYEAGYKVQHLDRLYRCISGHTAQAGWDPPSAPSIWAEVLAGENGGALPWRQPDSTNGYMAGDMVTNGEKTWVSIIDNNVWEPGVYGWVAKEETKWK